LGGARIVGEIKRRKSAETTAQLKGIGVRKSSGQATGEDNVAY
jgi:hypothetical protein